MNPHTHSAEEGLLSRIERWTPNDAEIWKAWRQSLSPSDRAEALFPLQAVLAGLLAFRQRENHPRAETVVDFRPHLYSAQVAYRWALGLVRRLCREGSPGRALEPVREPLGEPEASLRDLERLLIDSLRVSEGLLDLPVVDASVFQASCDLFLRELDHNAFFQPPDPLEFSSVADLVSGGGLSVEPERWRNEAATTTTLVAFLTLLRNYRYLGLADRQIGAEDGLYRAHVVLAGCRKELRTLTRFLLVQGVETFADELERRLLALDARQISEARPDITRASHELRELRASVETLATDLHDKVRAALDAPPPSLDFEQGVALPAERMRSGIREARAVVKEAAKRLRALAAPSEEVRDERQSERVERNLEQNIWAFRFIVRAFIAKAIAASDRVDDWRTLEDLSFAAEFVRHFRVFGSRLAKGTGYGRRGPLTRTISALSQRDAVDTEALDLAVSECEAFLAHLDDAIAHTPHSLLAPFDKRKAAAELRGYLAAAKDRAATERTPAAAFGAVDPRPAEAG